MALYPQVLGPFAVAPTTVAVGANLGFAAVAQGATIVSTGTLDGTVEANQTSYFVHYDRQPTDPQITLGEIQRTDHVVSADAGLQDDCVEVVRSAGSSLKGA
jgi:hypothetical protein